MDIIIENLSIENFKGIGRLELAFAPGGGRIVGDNGTGKTSVYDAFVWLLYGKDSLGRERFELRPLLADGSQARHLTTRVEAVLLVDGRRRTLKRTYYEKWARRREGEQFLGNACDYFVDAVALTRGGYQREVEKLLGEERFRLLTNAACFCSQLGWKERRGVLFDMAKVASDQELLENLPEFEELEKALQGATLELFRKKLEALRRSLVQQQDTVPARISENLDRARELEEQLGPEVQQRRKALEEEREKLDGLLAAAGERVERQRQTVAGVQARLRALEAENLAHRRQQQGPPAALLEEQRAAREEALRDAQRRVSATQGQLEAVEGLIRDTEKLMQELGKESDSPALCPQCGRRLSGAALERVLSSREHRRREEERYALARRDKAREEQKRLILRLEEEKEAVQRRREGVNQARQELEAARKKTIADLPGFRQQREELEQALEKEQQRLECLSQEDSGGLEELKRERERVGKNLAGLEQALASRALAERCRGRVEELRREEQRTREAVERADRMLGLCQDFLMRKAELVEEQVNSCFRFTRFRLYRPLVGGGLEECCDATFQGVPYESLNTGARLNVGLDVIGALSRSFGVRFPLFVDNGECVNHLADIDTQVIRLEVGRGPLRLEGAREGKNEAVGAD